jgi:hypothetical protein
MIKSISSFLLCATLFISTHHVHGMEKPTMPTTWEELLPFCFEMKKDQNGHYIWLDEKGKMETIQNWMRFGMVCKKYHKLISPTSKRQFHSYTYLSNVIHEDIDLVEHTDIDEQGAPWSDFRVRFNSLFSYNDISALEWLYKNDEKAFLEEIQQGGYMHVDGCQHVPTDMRYARQSHVKKNVEIIRDGERTYQSAMLAKVGFLCERFFCNNESLTQSPVQHANWITKILMEKNLLNHCATPGCGVWYPTALLGANFRSEKPTRKQNRSLGCTLASSQDSEPDSPSTNSTGGRWPGDVP